METATYRIEDTIEIALTAQISKGGSIEFDPGNDNPFASRALYLGDALLAENVSYDGLRVDDYAAAAEYLDQLPEDDRPAEADYDLDPEDPQDRRDINSALSQILTGADELYEDAKPDAKAEALQRMIEEDGWECFRSDGRFANEYTLYLVAAGKELDDDIDAETLTPEEWVEAWGRYPDPATESYVSVCVIQ